MNGSKFRFFRDIKKNHFFFVYRRRSFIGSALYAGALVHAKG